MDQHLKIVGIVNLVFGGLKALGGVVALVVLLLFGAFIGVAASQAGQAKARQQEAARRAAEERRALEESRREAEAPDETEPEGADPFAAPAEPSSPPGPPLSDAQAGAVAFGILGIIAVVAGAVGLVWGGVRIVVGIGLLRRRSWARVGAILLAALDLVNFPLGTLLGGYTLWVLLNPEVRRIFDPDVMEPSRSG